LAVIINDFGNAKELESFYTAAGYPLRTDRVGKPGQLSAKELHGT
jgi:hypothetical protein